MAEQNKNYAQNYASSQFLFIGPKVGSYVVLRVRGAAARVVHIIRSADSLAQSSEVAALAALIGLNLRHLLIGEWEEQQL
ncbi:hypothetical protein ANCCEY_15630 [Ancylostoma ceylanicum]|uniref:Uncharacterized protein n=1 Tax=Ancylostoma ceylanicum TaxID=53326 RepID=A0A0D6LC25_9BILA|nr:hypothetical protein ANCCEY_15630 [Ancylostoma ceylanicum]